MQEVERKEEGKIREKVPAQIEISVSDLKEEEVKQVESQFILLHTGLELIKWLVLKASVLSQALKANRFTPYSFICQLSSTPLSILLINMSTRSHKIDLFTTNLLCQIKYLLDRSHREGVQECGLSATKILWIYEL